MSVAAGRSDQLPGPPLPTTLAQHHRASIPPHNRFQNDARARNSAPGKEKKGAPAGNKGFQVSPDACRDSRLQSILESSDVFCFFDSLPCMIIMPLPSNCHIATNFQGHFTFALTAACFWWKDIYLFPLPPPGGDVRPHMQTTAFYAIGLQNVYADMSGAPAAGLSSGS